MLTSELVRVRRRGSELSVTDLGPRVRPLALDLAAHYVAAARACVGRTREDFDDACASWVAPARAAKLAAGLRKLVEDRCDFGMQEGDDPSALRLDLFARAAAVRAALPPGELLVREGVLAEVAAARDTTADDLDARLYADLRSAHVLAAFDELTPEELVATYELSQVQAVLLRATRVVVALRRAEPAALRALFRRLKFLRLLPTIQALPRGEHRVELEGPMALFGPTSKYGLQLALVVPALERVGPYRLTADVRWGPTKDRCTFTHEGGGRLAGSLDTTLADEIATLADRLRAAGSGWSVRANARILTLPGVGLCVPDLALAKDGVTVFVEVLGYWSRPAVWRRVELVERGLRDRIVFCVSSRLRVGEEALPDDVPACLYVYKGVLLPRAILDRVEALGAR